MFEINPVLSGKFSAADYAPSANNINRPLPNETAEIATNAETTSIDNTQQADARRYTKFDRTASQVGTAEMSFSDLLDAVNPLQHIPVVSSIYRAVAGEDIHPVSRVAGDILYGGAFGVASAVLGSIAGIGDSVMISQQGHSMAGVAMASLFTNDKKEADKQEPEAQVAQLAPSGASLTSTLPAQQAAEIKPLPAAPAPQVQTASVPPVPDIKLSDELSTTLASAKAIPLTRSKIPFGGVMDPTSNPALAMALAQSNHGTQLGHTIYPNLKIGGRAATPTTSQLSTPTSTVAKVEAPPLPAAVAPSSITSTASDQTSTAQSNSPAVQQNSAQQNLIKDLLALREFKKYPATAQAAPLTRGANVDITN